jgi:hypothetical protein
MRLERSSESELKPVHDWVKTYERFWSHQLSRIKQRAEQASPAAEPTTQARKRELTMPETGTATAKARLSRDLALPGLTVLSYRNVSRRIVATYRSFSSRATAMFPMKCKP